VIIEKPPHSDGNGGRSGGRRSRGRLDLYCCGCLRWLLCLLWAAGMAQHTGESKGRDITVKRGHDQTGESWYDLADDHCLKELCTVQDLSVMSELVNGIASRYHNAQACACLPPRARPPQSEAFKKHIIEDPGSQIEHVMTCPTWQDSVPRRHQQLRVQRSSSRHRPFLH
jgi:hypothetical protein